MFYCCFFIIIFHFHHEISVPSADRREILPHGWKCLWFYNTGLKLVEGLSPIFLGEGAKHSKLSSSLHDLTSNLSAYTYNFVCKSGSYTKLCDVTCREEGMIMWAQIWEGHTPEKFGNHIRAKIGTISGDFRLLPRIFLEWIEISTGGKRRYRLQSFPRWGKKWWTTNNDGSCVDIDPAYINFFRKTVFLPLRAVNFPGLASAYLTVNGGHPTTFTTEYQKLLLISKNAPL